MEGQIVRLTGGNLPDEFAKFTEPIAVAPPGVEPIAIDAAAFVSRPARRYQPPAELTEADVLRQFRWTREQLQVASDVLAFPRPRTLLIDSWRFLEPQTERRWLESEPIEQWRNAVRAVFGLDVG